MKDKIILIIFWAVMVSLMMVYLVRESPGQIIIPAEINLEIIKVLESGGDPHAYNKRSGATGLYQITKICLEDCIFSH